MGRQPAPRPGAVAGDVRSTGPEASRQLLLRAKGGDRQALDHLYARYMAPLRGWARGRLPPWARDLMETDDLVQETLLRTMNAVVGFDPQHSGAFLGYLRRAILNRVRDEIRRVGRRPFQDGTAGRAVDPLPSPVEQAIGRQAMVRYEAALDRLAPETREAVIARIELGMSYRQVAEILGKPSPDAARMLVSRALLKLAEAMADA